MTPEVEDVRLVATFLEQSSERAFREIYRRHTPFLLALSRRMLGEERAVEDVVQEAWIRAARLLPRFRWASSLRTWLAGIVVNCCREERRSWIARSEVAPAPARLTAPDRVQHIDLERAIVALPAELREVIVLHELAGFTHQEIGEQLGIAPGTSKSRLHHARRELIERLEIGDPRSGWGT